MSLRQRLEATDYQTYVSEIGDDLMTMEALYGAEYY